VNDEEAVDQPTFPRVEVAVASEEGLRDENQDWLSWTRTPRGELFVIADGMGGYKGGALAARMTVDAVEQFLSDAPADLPFGKAATEAIARANREVHRLAHSGDPETDHMGSTVLVVLLSEGQAQIAHVGDSRAYLYRNDKLQRLTRDHTRIQQMLDAKMLTQEQARNHPESHLLSRAIGSQPEVEVEVSEPIALKEGDALLLCSDGLSGFVTDDKIRAALNKQRDIQRIPDDLVDLALSSGGNDNVTVQFVRVNRLARGRVTAQIPVATILAQGRPRVAFSTMIRRPMNVAASLALMVVAVYVAFIIPPSQPDEASVDAAETAERAAVPPAVVPAAPGLLPSAAVPAAARIPAPSLPSTVTPAGAVTAKAAEQGAEAERAVVATRTGERVAPERSAAELRAAAERERKAEAQRKAAAEQRKAIETKLAAERKAREDKALAEKNAAAEKAAAASKAAEEAAKAASPPPAPTVADPQPAAKEPNTNNDRDDDREKQPGGRPEPGNEPPGTTIR
jgi:protein phosphatase